MGFFRWIFWVGFYCQACHLAHRFRRLVGRHSAHPRQQRLLARSNVLPVGIRQHFISTDNQCFVDRHRFDVDPDPNFRYDAEPDPDRHQDDTVTPKVKFGLIFFFSIF